MEFIAFLLVLQIASSLLLAGLMCLAFCRWKRHLRGIARLLRLSCRYGKKLLELLIRLWQKMPKAPPNDLDNP